jgi:hypothetical protein
MLACGVVLLHDNARPHTAAGTRALLEHFNWELFDHRPCSPDLAPSDYYFLLVPTRTTGWDHGASTIMRMEDVKTWLSSQAADFFDAEVQKVISQYKCNKSGGEVA